MHYTLQISTWNLLVKIFIKIIKTNKKPAKTLSRNVPALSVEEYWTVNDSLWPNSGSRSPTNFGDDDIQYKVVPAGISAFNAGTPPANVALVLTGIFKDWVVVEILNASLPVWSVNAITSCKNNDTESLCKTVLSGMTFQPSELGLRIQQLCSHL